MATAPVEAGENGTKQAAEFMSRAIEIIAAQVRSDAEGAAQFFPDGIDLISLKFKIGTALDISLAVSGKSCCKSAGLSTDAADARQTRPLRTALASASLATEPTTSLEADATDCLIDAIGRRFNVHVGPEEFEDLKPSDLGAQDDLMWLKCLNTATKCLRPKGWQINDFESAEALFGKTLLASLRALIQAAS